MKAHTVEDLVNAIYEDNSIHFDFDEDMNGGECDCHLHTTIKTIVEYAVKYWEKAE